jgi:hypothetical protein
LSSAVIAAMSSSVSSKSTISKFSLIRDRGGGLGKDDVAALNVPVANVQGQLDRVSRLGRVDLEDPEA